MRPARGTEALLQLEEEYEIEDWKEGAVCGLSARSPLLAPKRTESLLLPRTARR